MEIISKNVAMRSKRQCVEAGRGYAEILVAECAP